MTDSRRPVDRSGRPKIPETTDRLNGRPQRSAEITRELWQMKQSTAPVDRQQRRVKRYTFRKGRSAGSQIRSASLAQNLSAAETKKKS